MRRGLSLVETMVSVCIFFLVVILVFNLYPSAVVSLRKGEQRTRADHLAQSALNQARNQAFSSLVVGSTASYSLDSDNTTYQWNVTVGQIPGENVNLVKSLTVTLYWSERDQPRSTIHQVWVSNVTR